MKIFILSVCSLVMLSHVSMADQPAILAKANAHLQSIKLDPAAASTSGASLPDLNDGRPDLETKFGPFIFGIARNQKQLLSESQREQWDATIEKHKKLRSQFHDERNTVRCFQERLAWKFAVADEQVASDLRTQVTRWLKLRLAYMSAEADAQERFEREMWNILTDDQKAKLIAGEWDSFIKKNTGHTKSFFSDKIVRRALGAPDFPDKANATIESSRSKYMAAHKDYVASASLLRRLQTAKDICDQTSYMRAHRQFMLHYKKLTIMDIESRREIIQAGYKWQSPACKAKADDAGQAMWDNAVKKYSHADQLIKMLDP